MKNRGMVFVLQMLIGRMFSMFFRIVLLLSVVFVQMSLASLVYAQDQQAIYKYLGVDYPTLAEAEAEMRKPRVNDLDYDNYARDKLKQIEIVEVLYNNFSIINYRTEPMAAEGSLVAERFEFLDIFHEKSEAEAQLLADIVKRPAPSFHCAPPSVISSTDRTPPSPSQHPFTSQSQFSSYLLDGYNPSEYVSMFYYDRFYTETLVLSNMMGWYRHTDPDDLYPGLAPCDREDTSSHFAKPYGRESMEALSSFDFYLCPEGHRTPLYAGSDTRDRAEEIGADGACFSQFLEDTIQVEWQSCPAGTAINLQSGQCEPIGLSQQCGPDIVGDTNTTTNPCHVATGNKALYHNDLALNKNVYVTRSYNSNAVRVVLKALSNSGGSSGGSSNSANFRSLNSLVQVGFGRGWTSNLHKRLLIEGTGLVHVSSHSRLSYFASSSSSGRSSSRAGSAAVGIVMDKKAEGEGIDIILPNGVTEHYSDVDGRLLYETDINGNVTNYIYTGDLLTRVEDYLGKAIILTYNANDLVTSITDPSGAEYRYSYTDDASLSGQFNLSSVTYPGNQTRHYHYEDPINSSLLTGITDENGHRYSTYAYNGAGKAILSGHAQTTSSVPQELFELDFQEQVPEGDTVISKTIEN